MKISNLLFMNLNFLNMKSVSFFIFLFLSNCLQAQSQSYKFSYSEVPDTVEMFEKISSFGDELGQNKLKKSFRFVNYRSLYFSENILKNEFDSLVWLNKGGYHSSPNSTFFINFKEGKQYFYSAKYDTVHLGYKNIEKHDYKLINEFKQINNLKCQKAILEMPNEKQIVFWFTKELPFPVCPSSRYAGLPGLVVLLEDKQSIYRLEKIEKIDYKFDFSKFVQSKKLVDWDVLQAKIIELVMSKTKGN